MKEQSWNLVADIGGTNARFGLQVSGTCELAMTHSYSVAEYPAFEDALQRFLQDVAGTGHWKAEPDKTCLALACPTEGDRIQLTNSPWQVDRARLSARLGGKPLQLINDFTAVGYGVTGLDSSHWVQLGGGEPEPGGPIGVLGPGTGLGVCSVVPVASGYCVLGGEGGHVDFAPVDSLEVELLQALSTRFGRVSVERLLSGAGLVNIYRELSLIRGCQAQADTPADITRLGVSGADALAVNTLDIFCRVLGSVAGNLALTLGARGGIYLAGGILPRIVDFVSASELRSRFEAKGRFQAYLAPIPIRLVTRDNLGLWGAARKLQLEQ